MKKELDEMLCEKYPKIFGDRNKSMKETCMCWGFEHGDGWFNIINAMCSSIQHHIDWSRTNRNDALRFNRALRCALTKQDKTSLIKFFTYGKNDPGSWAIKSAEAAIASAEYREVPAACPQVVAEQVKEKFGTLRFYYRGGDEYVRGVVDMAENMSSITCEACGNPGECIDGGWIRTLCEEHVMKKI